MLAGCARDEDASDAIVEPTAEPTTEPTTVTVTPTTDVMRAPSETVEPPGAISEIERRDPLSGFGRIELSPDGTLFIDEEGCVGVVDRDVEPVCAEGPSGVQSADWSPDGSAVVFDEPAFMFDSDSDIWLATVRSVDTQNRDVLDVRFSNLTDDATDDFEAGDVDVLPLFFADDEIRFLRLADGADAGAVTDATVDVVTVDRAGSVSQQSETGLALGQLARLEAVGVAGRHVVALAAPPDGSRGTTTWASVDANGSVTEHVVERDVSPGFLPLDTSPDGSLAALAVIGPASAPGPPTTATVATGPIPLSVEIVVFDGDEIAPIVLQTAVPLDVVAGFAASFDPSGERLVTAAPIDVGTTALWSWDRRNRQVTPLGPIDVGTVRDIRWVEPSRAIVLGSDGTVELALTP